MIFLKDMMNNSLKILGSLVFVAVFTIASITGAETVESAEHESKWFRFDRFIN